MQNPQVPRHGRRLLVETLKAIARKKSITNKEIATYTGFHESHVSRFFANKFPPTLDNFIAIASALGVNLFIQSRDDGTDLSKAFESAMEVAGRRPPKGRDN